MKPDKSGSTEVFVS